jgi:hypothetical protein
MPLLHKEAVNQQPISNTSEQIKMDGSQPTQITLLNEGDMQNVRISWPANIKI